MMFACHSIGLVCSCPQLENYDFLVVCRMFTLICGNANLSDLSMVSFSGKETNDSIWDGN
jgi:hypothetical protein